MADIKKITKLTDEKFVNLYEADGVNSKGHESHYLIASRAKNIDELKITTGENHPDGVIIYTLYGEKRDRVVMIRQFRYPVGRFVYELPAGLVEKGEDVHEAAIRELHEETGLKLTIVPADPLYEAPRYTTIGMTDESCATVYGYADGTPSAKFEEASEEIEVLLVDRSEARRILAEEEVALNCAYHLMHFISDEEPFAFLKGKAGTANI